MSTNTPVHLPVPESHFGNNGRIEESDASRTPATDKRLREDESDEIDIDDEPLFTINDTEQLASRLEALTTAKTTPGNSPGAERGPHHERDRRSKQNLAEFAAARLGPDHPQEHGGR